MDRFEVAAALRETAAWLRFRGQGSYRARAYDRGAAAVEVVPDLDERAREGALQKIAGIGPSLAAQIEELLRDERSSYLERVRGGLPSSLLELPEAAHLSPAKVLAVYHTLGICDRAGLRAAAEEGRLRAVRGFGAKTEARVAQALASPVQTDGRLTIDKAEATAGELASFLRATCELEEVVVAGEVRRACPLVHEIALVACASDAARARAAVERLALSGRLAATDAVDDTGLDARLPGGTRLSFRAVDREHFGQALLVATGPPEHATQVEELVLDAGRELEARVERELYARANLPDIPPEQRERTDVIEAALDGEDLSDLVAVDDLRGVVHCHTSYSDGRDSLEAMVRGAEARGYEYITITDHSPSAHYAGGLALDQLKRLWQEIDELQPRVRVRILRGTESDITRDGSLDYPDEILEQLDVVIASIHTRHGLDKDAMTERVVRAMSHPVFKIWGHALGRILLRREPYACDLSRILDAIAESPAAIEISGDPYRLDLAPEHIPAARARGIRFVISADAHSVHGLEAARYGVGIARRAGVRRDEVLNTLPVDDFLSRVRPAR